MERKTYSFHDVQPEECTTEVNTTQNELCDERILDTNGLKDCRSIVEASPV